MKRCPHCSRIETDDALVFCRVDGIRLVPESADAESPTRILGDTASRGAQLTEFSGRDTGESASTTLPFAASTDSSTRRLAQPRATRMSGRKLAIIIAIVLAVIFVPILILGLAGLYAYRHALNTEVAIESIAVLPFVNENKDQNVEWVSDGLTESIINSLTQLLRRRAPP